MIRLIRGTVFEKVRQQLVVEVHGVGYDLFVTPTLIASATIGEEVLLYVSESIREDAHDLFGFLAATERDMFELLRKVSGVGPKVALALIGFYAPNELFQYIQLGDSTKLSLVPGIGKKMASKIIVELRDKSLPVPELKHTDDDDTVAALQSLGYSPAEIAVVLPKVPEALQSSQEKITWILRHLGG